MRAFAADPSCPGGRKSARSAGSSALASATGVAHREDGPLRLIVLAHANRTGGPRSVALDLLSTLATENQGTEIIGVLPVGCGYEEIADRLSPSTMWFDQRGSVCRRLFFDAIILPLRLRSIRPDAVLALGSIGMRSPEIPQLILLQDPHFVYPQRYYGNMPILEHVRYIVQRRQVAHCLQTASTVYCQTSTMLERARKTFRIQGQMKLLPKSVALRVSRGPANGVTPAELAPFADCFRLICLTRYYPHKNLEAIVQVFRQFREELRRVVVFLTISPTQGSGARRLLASIERYDLSEQIVNLGPMKQDHIPAYFQSCHAMLFPTIMESFSAAYLEAMVLGLPILTSDLDFAREVCGSAALYFDPWNLESILDAVIRARQDVMLRQQLIASGRTRLAEAYSQSWKDIAAQVATDLRQVTASRGRCNPGETAREHSSIRHV